MRKNGSVMRYKLCKIDKKWLTTTLQVKSDYPLRNAEELNKEIDKLEELVDNTIAELLYDNPKLYITCAVIDKAIADKEKKAKEKEILDKEKEASELKKKYFSPEGELYKKRESLIGPIQEQIYTAVKTVAEQRGYQLVLDRASDNGIVFASPAADISNEVLAKLGYSK